jgi:predicted amidophosphoribosyltransferase
VSAALEILLAPRCAGCDAAGAWLCLACRAACEPVARGRLRAASTYGGAIARAIHRFKYRGERALATELGMLVAGCVARDLARGVAAAAVDHDHFMPLRAQRRERLERGANALGLVQRGDDDRESLSVQS